MRSWPDMHSPWGKQLRFEEQEFESMMDEMRARSGDCFEPQRGIDVDRVLMKAIGTEADYVDLPSGVLGRTAFSPDGRVTIEISRELAERAAVDRVARRRLRSTLAHECGHIACHTGLFIRDTETYSLFPATSNASTSAAQQPIMCRADRVGNSGYSGEWWEYQANRCMAALLMPKSGFGTFVRRWLSEADFESGERCVAAGSGELMIRAVSDEFDVSQIAALYRIQDLGFVPKGAQRTLQLID